MSQLDLEEMTKAEEIFASGAETKEESWYGAS